MSHPNIVRFSLGLPQRTDALTEAPSAIVRSSSRILSQQSSDDSHDEFSVSDPSDDGTSRCTPLIAGEEGFVFMTQSSSNNAMSASSHPKHPKSPNAAGPHARQTL